MRRPGRGASAVVGGLVAISLLLAARGPAAPAARFSRRLYDAEVQVAEAQGGGEVPAARESGFAWLRRRLGGGGGVSGGVVLWAYGRSATDAFAGTLQKSSKFRYCAGQKEGFKGQRVRLSQETLTNCIRRNERVTHLKPWHLEGKKSKLTTVEDFFPAVKAAGFTVVVASFRFNQLARDVSALELTQRPQTAASRAAAAGPPLGAPRAQRFAIAQKAFCKAGLLTTWGEDYDTWRAGTKRAASDGLDVMELSFAEVTTGLCDSVKRTLAKLPGWPKQCRVFDSPHSRTSHHGQTIQQRIGPAAHACVLRHFKRVPLYSWMLDDHAEVPPKGWNASDGTANP